MKNELYSYQREAVEKIVHFFYSDLFSGSVILPAGVGKSVIIATVIEKILKNDRTARILIFCSHNEILQQYRKIIDQSVIVLLADSLLNIKKGNVFLCSVQDLLLVPFDQIEKNSFDLIIYEDVDRFYLNRRDLFIKGDSKTKYLEITNRKGNRNRFNRFFQPIYEYRMSEAFEDGVIHQSLEKSFITNFFISLLKYLGYLDIVCEKQINSQHQKYCIDVMAKKDGMSYLFEVKTYRDSIVSSSLVKQAIHQVEKIKQNIEGNICSVLVMNCIVDSGFKKRAYDEKQIEIWDICNILYLVQFSQDLMNKLCNIMPYSVTGIEKQALLSSQKSIESIIQDSKVSYYQIFEKRLKNCPAGKEENTNYEYQNICNDIILYLFSGEFLQKSFQHRTKDNMFQMDLLCSLKGTTEFWKFLIQFYHTKFVVFEYKNYSDLVPQNSIYITQKYLFSSALRNVAFVISRHGFHENAYFVSMGILKDEKQLIIDLTDEDLLIMIALKEKGEEPSDYLLDKIEKLLMSMSI